MVRISAVRITAPRAALGEILREDLVASILDSHDKITYIDAGAGFGKTTLLSQVAGSVDKVVWATLDGESDVFSILTLLGEAVRHTFPLHEFNASEYMPFESKDNFTTLLTDAFINSIEKLEKDIMFFLDDLHTVSNTQVRQLIACILKYKPENVRFCLSSREAPWHDLIPLLARGIIKEITQNDLAFTREETALFFGFRDESIYRITEGWPIAIRSFKVLLENGASVRDIASGNIGALYAYLFYECVSRLSSETVDFLRDSAFCDELEPQMLDIILDKKNTRLILDSLANRNIFTTKTHSGYFRYHPLFRELLMKSAADGQSVAIQRKAVDYYLTQHRYSEAAVYAQRLSDRDLLGQIILICYRDEINNGNFSELRGWFNALYDGTAGLSPELLVAKGALLSTIGNFTEAGACLDRAIPLLDRTDNTLYMEAMIHKARVLRNSISFEESNRLLDELTASLDDPSSELSYRIVIEKIYNLCWNSQIKDAYELTEQMVRKCAQSGNIRVKAWYERYLAVIHYVAGRMKDSVYEYEKSLAIPEEERKRLDMHSVDVYVAKSYQMLGNRDMAVSLVTEGVQRLRSMGRYEELWLGYLFAAEIFYQNAAIDKMNGIDENFEITKRFFRLANEYAPLYRISSFQTAWTKLQSNIYGLMFNSGSKEKMIEEIYEEIPNVGDHFKTVALGRLYNYFGSIGDFKSAESCAQLSIEIGERANTMMVASMAYGFLARIALSNGEKDKAVLLIRRFLQVCDENGIYEYFRMRKAYDPILAFASENGIEPATTKQIMNFVGYECKKIFITTFGSFSIYHYNDKEKPIKMRTKKGRELLAFLLETGKSGATKEQIYQALWFESDSADVKKLIGVYLAQLKKDLSCFDGPRLILRNGNRYSILRNEIEVDADLYEKAAQEFRARSCHETAHKLVTLYKGEYLAEFEGHWAVAKRSAYARIYDEALEYCNSIR